MRALALSLTLVALAGSLAAAVPTSAAVHVCRDDEPAWECEHRDPTPQELAGYSCSLVPRACGGNGPIDVKIQLP